MKVVRAWEENLVIPTYESGEENENPDLIVEGNYRMYPYTRRMHLKGIKSDFSYKAVCIENEYLKLVILPERGGRVYSAHDKITGKDLFYKNSTIKPALIQTKGTWIAAGLEFNFPMGHSITSYETVDYRIFKCADGSAGVAVGNIDLVTRMRWTVFIKLYPGISYMEVSVKLNNRSSLPERYYYWANAAVDTTDGLRLVFPASRMQGDITFPKYKGRDLTYSANFKEGAGEIFTHNSPENFFGYYNEDYKFGMAHYANRFEVPGKKFFTWGTRYGTRWKDFLADADMPAYTEFQCGPFETQLYFEFLNPYDSNNFKQYYMPVRGTKGFVIANPEGALNLIKTTKDSALEIYFSPNRILRKAVLSLALGGKLLYKRTVNLDPAKPFFDTAKPGRKAGSKELVFEITLEDKVIFRYHSIYSKLGLYESYPDEKSGKKRNSAQKLYLEGIANEKKRLFREAEKSYLAALENNPKYAPAMLRLGIIALSSGLFEKAEKRFKEVISIDRANREVFYYQGLSYKLAGKNKIAKEAFWKLRLNDSYLSSASLVELGKIALSENKYEEALEVLEKAYGKCGNNPKVAGLYVAALRKAGKLKEAKHFSADALENDPIDCLLLSEYSLLHGGKQALRELNKNLHRCKEAGLELAMDYMQAGLWEETVKILELAKKKYPSYPLYYYYQGFSLEKLGRKKEAVVNYRLGALKKDKRVFPWQLESLEVLDRAIKSIPNLPNTYEYAGNFLTSKLRYKDGLRYFYKAKQLGSKSSVVYRNIAIGHLQEQTNHREIAGAYEHSVRCNPDDWELYYEADKFLAGYGYSEQRKRIEKMVSPKVMDHPKALERKAKFYVDTGEYDKAIEFISKRQLYPWEGEFVPRQIYEEAWNGKAEELAKKGNLAAALDCIEQALLYPENIGIHKSSWRVECRSQLLKYIIYKKMGEDRLAKKAIASIVKVKVDGSMLAGEFAFYFALERFFFYSFALSIRGKQAEAAKMLAKVVNICRKDHQRLILWCTYLENWKILKSGEKTAPRKSLECGFKIPKAQFDFAAQLAKLVNKRIKDH